MLEVERMSRCSSPFSSERLGSLAWALRVKCPLRLNSRVNRAVIVAVYPAPAPHRAQVFGS